MPIQFADIAAARARIAAHVFTTPCPESTALSELCGATVFCKLEYLQRTGSFKERGAVNALLQLTPEQMRRGVIAASAGNHALALSFHGQRLGIPVTVVMPRFAPLIKQSRSARYDARIVLGGDDFAAAKARADEIAAAEGLTYIHGYDDPAIIAGQGVIGIELCEQAPDLDAVIVPIGGAGLIAGVALAVKSLKPAVEVIGVEPEHAPKFSQALAAGGPVTVPPRPTLADGLAIARVGQNAFDLAARHVDRVVQVDEQAIALAIVRLMEMEKSVVEGAGAAPLAAVLSRQLPHLAGKRVALLLCGGNIDLATLSRLIESALVADGRLTRFSAVISDRPGGLASLAHELAEAGASVKEITHDRTFTGPDVTTVRVACIVETRDHAHVEALFAHLARHGIQFTR